MTPHAFRAVMRALPGATVNLVLNNCAKPVTGVRMGRLEDDDHVVTALKDDRKIYLDIASITAIEEATP